MLNPEDYIDFYFEELLSWMSTGYTPIRHPVYTQRDFVNFYEEYPPEQGVEPVNRNWPAINIWDLKMEEKPAKERVFLKSPTHHVFLTTMLELVQMHPEELIELYAEHRSIMKLLAPDGYNGEIKCIQLFISDLEEYLKTKHTQLIPLLLHTSDHGLLMSKDIELIRELHIEGSIYEFGFSKATSDAFTKVLIECLNKRLDFLNHLILDKNPGIQEDQDITPPFSENKSVLSFMDLFYEEGTANRVIEFLRGNKILNDAGLWSGLTKSNTEVLTLIDVLIQKGYLKRNKQTVIARLFCEQFGIELKDRSLRYKSQSRQDVVDRYMVIIPDLQ